MDVFGGAPRFLAYPRPVGVQSGADAVLKCQIGGDPRPAVIWERNNEKIDPQGRYRVFEDGNIYNLIITAVTIEDSGQYMCKAKNSIGETYAAATLKVEGEAQELELREENKPRFLIKPLSTRAGRGEDAVFSCKLWGSPRPEVTWEKDGRKLSEIFESTHFSVSYQDGGWFQLKIFKTRAPDGGVYTCKARNDFGEALAGAVLLVDAGPGHEEDGNRNGYTNGHRKAHQGKQRISRQNPNQNKDQTTTKSTRVKMFAVTEGKHAKFRCFVTGKPKPEIIWRKDGRLILSGRRYLLYEDREGYFTLKVLYCKQKDNGVYVCAASNTAGQTLSAVHLSVKEPPVRFKQPLIDLEVWEQDLAVLECEVPEDSVPITWYLEDRRLQPGAKYGMEEWGTKRRLTIRDIGVDDDGIYLCEMPDGGRSIAEVAVKGPIMRKLPRKVDVLEGENAAFCVEVEKEEMDIHWYKDGVELRETHQTILKSFGRTHILVFVNTMPQDSGFVTFFVGRSKTSAQLRVKAAKHCPPSCPVGVQINTERANAALLSWTSAQDSRKNPPSGYVLERQEVGTGSQEWLQCLTTDSATSVEILGDSVPCEADYRFRICSVNKYGKSNNVEFPRAVHLVPVARIQTPLQDALVPEGQDAVFTIELSASVIGSWFLNGTQLQDDERFSMRRSRTHQSLRIQGVRDTENGAEITFIAYGIRDSAALYIQAPLVKFSLLSEMDRNKFVEIGNPIVLYCELSDPAAPVHWYKNGVELQTTDGLHIQSEGTMRRIVILSAEFSHSGVYCCDAIDDVIRFNVEVEAPSVRFSAIPEAARNKTVHAGSSILLRCELSDHDAHVHWYKDGSKLFPQSGVNIQTDGLVRKLVIPSADFYHSGLYCCKTKGDTVTFNVNIKAPPVKFYPLAEEMTTKSIEVGNPVVLQCVVSDPEAHVCWYKDGTQLVSSSELEIQLDGTTRTLVVHFAELHHSGVYQCTAKDDSVDFQVEIKAKPTMPSNNFDAKRAKSFEMGEPLVLECEVADSTLPAQWYKDGVKLFPNKEQDIQSNGTLRRLIVPSAELVHAGQYNCETSDESVHFTVDMKAPSVPSAPSLKFLEMQSLEAPWSFEPTRQTSDPESHCPRQAVVSLQKVKAAVSNSEQDVGIEDIKKTLVIEPRNPSNSGAYYCATADDVAPLVVNTQVPAVTYGQEVERAKSAEERIPIVQQFEISDPIAKACWYKDGTPIYPKMETLFEPESNIQVFPPPVTIDLSGVASFSCETSADAKLNVDIKAEQCHYDGEIGEISDASAQITAAVKENDQTRGNSNFHTPFVGLDDICPTEQAVTTQQYQSMVETTVQTASHHNTEAAKDQVYVTLISGQGSSMQFSGQGLPMQFSGSACFEQTSSVQSEESYPSRTCGSHSNVTANKVAVEAPPVTISTPCQTERINSVKVDDPIALPVVVPCELSPPGEVVNPYEDGIQLQKKEASQDTPVDGAGRELALHSDVLSNAGVYSCETTDDAMPFQVDIKVPLQTFSAITEAEQKQTIMAGCPVALQCELLDPTGQVTWYHDGTRLLLQTGIDIQSRDNLRSLVIQSTELAHSGVYRCESNDGDIQFTVEVKALPTKFSELQEADRNKTFQEGCPIVLLCELSQDSVVDWYKDGLKLQQQKNLEIQTDGLRRKLFIPSAESTHSGMYECATADDTVTFKVDVKGRLPHIAPIPQSEKHRMIAAGSPIILQCEVSNPVAQVSWFKDEAELFCKTGLDMKRDGNLRKLIIHSAKTSDSGLYGCKLAEDVVTFHVNIQAAPVRFAAIPDRERNKLVEAGCPVKMQCEVSEPTAEVHWHKDGGQLLPKSDFEIQTEETLRALIIKAAEVRHSGVYSCDSADDHIEFKVDVAALILFSAVPEVKARQAVEAGDTDITQCKGSGSTDHPAMHEDGIKRFSKSATKIDSEDLTRTPDLDSARSSVSGVYGCKCDDESESNDCYVEVKAPPVTFADIPKEELFKSMVEKSQLSLSCEVSRVDAVVQWYKDGAEIQPSRDITIRAEATKRHLAIESAQLSDSGMYTCRAGDNTVMFKVNIREPPVMIVYPKEDVHLDRHVPEEIILSCELSRPNGVVSWYKDGQKLQKSENIKLKVEGPYRRLKILKSGVDDSGEYVCDTADDSIFFNLTITEPPVKIVSPSQSQMELCQQMSERMVLSCEISRPNAVVRWYRDGLEVEESDNLILEVDGVYRRLIIPETTVKDSAEYVCDTTDDSMTFFVNIAEPPVRFVRPRKIVSRIEKMVGETLVLDCEVSRPNAVVFWKKNREEVEDSKNVTVVEDGVVRQLTVHSLTVEDAGTYVCDAKDDVMDFHVKVKELPVQIIGKTNAKTEKQFLVSDDIILVCELSRPNASVSWYKDDQPFDNTERYCSEEQGVFRSLVVLNASLEDSGEYTCDAVDDKMVFHITVTEPPVKIVGNSGHPEHHILVAGEELILECEVSRPNATVRWLWNDKILKPDTRVKIYSHDIMRKLILSRLQPSDSGKYVCDAADDKMITIVDVQEVPVKFVNKKATNKILAYENESATLCAIVSRDKANVRWLKDGQLLNKDNIHISSECNTHKLTINPLQLSDSGDYVCDANTDDMFFSLFVKEMKVKFIRPLENVTSLKGSSLTLRCEINKPKGDVQWVKDGQEILPSCRYRIRAQGRERSFTIFEVLDEDAGKYACESTDDSTLATVIVNTPRVVEFIAELRNITVREGEDAVFKCVVSPADTQLVFCLNGKQVAWNERTDVSSNGLCHMLRIRNCMVSDSGIVTADAEGLISKAELRVQEQQVMFTKKMTAVTAEEYGEVTLQVEVSLDSREVQWMRQGVLLHPGAKYTLKNKGHKHSLTIHTLAMSDRGTYSCETLHDCTQAQLTVEPRKITIKKGLTDIKTMERETASYEVELSHPNVTGTWWRNGNQLKLSNHFRMSAKGRVHSLTISNLSVEDSATFMFCVEKLKTSARLIVKEPPVTIFRKLEDQKIPEGSVVSIECELSRHNVDVKWMKNGSELKPGMNVRIYAIGRKRFLQITKCLLSDSGMYTCDAGEVATSGTVEVYERELLVVQGLEDLNIAEDQNAVFDCEISVEDVPGEWYKNGEMIHPTSTIKTRQEGTKHFLLMCNVRPEDSGEIKFVARHVESVAKLQVKEIPLSIVKPLQDKTALEKSRVMLDCTVSNPRCSIRWYKGSNVILPSERFEISSEGCYRKLIIQQVALDDEGTYSMQVGENTCSAKLTVEAQTVLMIRELRDVEVVAPSEACFECEVSDPVQKLPMWTLNGEPLQPGAQACLEKLGTVHRLTLKQTSMSMSGAVVFTCGKAESTAHLHVLSGP
ncbi:obscurin-like protein 1 isoform X6 [Phyllopteryx taeniolatus]|uniref:obscurin-like protein 1 isoform X6 n=1 Tax=Phyllopteryx taeniolatus TaxID=161469 RepID=UPI002AD5811C|nr:obscurin-like protein 1 isoform X6 [Phyllopteryx taeniolatus]